MSWFHKQHYSWSGFIHVWFTWLHWGMASIFIKTGLQSRWRNVIRRGLFLYHEDLLNNIMQHPLWVALNTNRPKQIIIDLVIKPFRGSNKSIKMISVREEWSKKTKRTKSSKNSMMDCQKRTPYHFCNFPTWRWLYTCTYTTSSYLTMSNTWEMKAMLPSSASNA
jgi:hypothetical protein